MTKTGAEMEGPQLRRAPDEVVGAALANAFTWTRIIPFAGDLENVLGVTDATFAAFDDLTSEHRYSETGGEDDDGESVVELFSIPIYLPAGYVWEVEIFDNGDDAGSTHYLHVPGRAARVELGTFDAHPRLSVLRWCEAALVAELAARDVRNGRTGVAPVALLLLWPTVDVATDDPVEEIRAALEAAWHRSGLVEGEGAAELAADISPNGHWTADAQGRWVTSSADGRRRVGSDLADVLGTFVSAMQRAAAPHVGV